MNHLPSEETDFFRHLLVTPADLTALKGNKFVIAIHHAIPLVLEQMSWADFEIGRTMWETVPFPSTWVSRLNIMDEIWVPAEFNKETFVEAGLDESKLFVLGECGDEHYENFEDDGNRIYFEGKRGFNFLSMFNWNYR